MNDVKERMRAVFNELAREFLVPDLMTAESRVLFLLESPHWHVIDNVPHPSYDSWSRPQYAQVIQRVRQAFQADGLHPN